MGISYTCTCNSCQYEETFYIGAGMMDYSPNSALRTFSDVEREKVQEFIRSHQIYNCNVQRKLAEGIHNGKQCLALATTIKLETTDKQVREFVSYSKELDEGSVKFHEENELTKEKIACPNCAKDLNIQMTGYWD